MLRSRPKNIANTTKCVEDYNRYKRQRNYVCNLNRRLKKLFFADDGSSKKVLSLFGTPANHTSPRHQTAEKKSFS